MQAYYRISSIVILNVSLNCRQTPQFDMKCDGACWYCSGKCDNCMKSTSFDRAPLLGYHVGYPVRFCDDECIKHYSFNRNNSATQILFHTETKPADATAHRHFLTVSCGLLGTDLERNKVVAQFYLDSGSRGNSDRNVYVLLQIRFIPAQRFLAYVLSSEFSPVNCLPNPLPLTDEDTFITAGLQLVMKNLLEHFKLPDLSSFVSLILEDASRFPEQFMEMSPPVLSLNFLPNGFRISEEDKTIVYPNSYSMVLHKTEETYTTYLLANNMAAEVKKGGRFLALFCNFSVDCTIKVAYAVEDNPVAIAVKKFDSFESQALPGSYDELMVESCKNIVCIELTSMLQEKEADHLETLVTNYK